MTSNYTSPGTCNLLGPTLAEMCRTSAFVMFMTQLEEMMCPIDKISGVSERVKPIDAPNEEYDFVVIGGGGGGCIVAAELAKIPDWNVLLLEAGPDEPIGAEVPLFASALIRTRIDWNFTTTNESYACRATNGSCSVSTGKCLGGSTAHNGMKYLRGCPKDYNNWAALGNIGWSWHEVKKFFLKAEDNGEIDRVGRHDHSTNGPLRVERFPYQPPLADSILTAAEQIGYGVSEDLNGKQLTGFSVAQTTNHKGVRRSSAASYLWPLRKQKNLHVSINSQATRIILNGKIAVGVEYYKNGVLKTVRAKREVIVSAGTFQSPHLLLLSGIGPKEHLKSVGIEPKHDLPGVGENLHDHATNLMTFTINDTAGYDNNHDIADQYLRSQTGPLSSSGLSQVVATLASSLTAPDFPDIQMTFGGYNAACAPGEKGTLRSTGPRSIMIRASILHPKSRGRVSLLSKNPLAYPSIWMNYLSHPEDVKRMIIITKMALALTKTKALQAHNFTLSTPPVAACSDYAYLTDEYWACAIRYGQPSDLHPVGSCKMGHPFDRMAVVDPRLRVYGVIGLRVADASIIPVVTSGNTAAPSMMIGDRAADFIKKDWGRF